MATFSERLKQGRSEKKLTQQEIANRMGVNRVTYTNWENGKREPEIDKVVELATELNYTVDYLLGIDDVNVLALADDYGEMNDTEREEVQKLLLKNFLNIKTAAKRKFNMTDEQIDEQFKIILQSLNAERK